MASHFSSIGFPITTEQELIRLADAIGPLAVGIPCDEGTYFHWHDPSGAEVWLQQNRDDEFLGVNPHFAGNSRLAVRLVNRVKSQQHASMDGSFYAWLDPEAAIEGEATNDQQGLYPFVFDSPEFCRLAPLELPITIPMQICGVAIEVEVFADEASFMASQGDGPKFASRAFFPAGLFHPDGTETPLPEARVIMTGIVLSGERRLNTYTNAPFYAVELETLGGSYDLAIDISLLPQAPHPGNILTGSFWLSGRVILD
ncbi:MAG: hypothetical protein ACRC8S_06510 [Fimbriiglobus sp.]